MLALHVVQLTDSESRLSSLGGVLYKSFMVGAFLGENMRMRNRSYSISGIGCIMKRMVCIMGIKMHVIKIHTHTYVHTCIMLIHTRRI